MSEVLHDLSALPGGSPHSEEVQQGGERRRLFVLGREHFETFRKLSIEMEPVDIENLKAQRDGNTAEGGTPIPPAAKNVIPVRMFKEPGSDFAVMYDAEDATLQTVIGSIFFFVDNRTDEKPRYHTPIDWARYSQSSRLRICTTAMNLNTSQKTKNSIPAKYGLYLSDLNQVIPFIFDLIQAKIPKVQPTKFNPAQKFAFTRANADSIFTDIHTNAQYRLLKRSENCLVFSGEFIGADAPDETKALGEIQMRPFKYDRGYIGYFKPNKAHCQNKAELITLSGKMVMHIIENSGVAAGKAT